MPEQSSSDHHHLVIVGAGFAGLFLAKALRRAPLRITIVDKRNFHLFQPLLYQVATGSLSSPDIATPIRAVLRSQANVTVVQAQAVDVNPDEKILTHEYGELHYDTLVVASGVKHAYFGNDQWRKDAPGLKTLEHALEIRRRVLDAFEAAELEDDPKRRDELLTFVIVGAGPTGVELAGAIAELAHRTLPKEFRRIDPGDANVYLIEGADRVLPPYPPELSAAAAKALRKRNVEIWTNSMVQNIDGRDVAVSRSGEEWHLKAATTLWAAGVTASRFGRAVARATGAETDRAGKLRVNADLSLPGHADIFIAGDLAWLEQDGTPIPGVAPVAKQQGRFLARLLQKRLTGETEPTFHYKDRGSLAVIAVNAAVADFGRFRLSGWLAWWLWAVAHVFFLIGFEQKLLVMIRWTRKYLTRQRGVRLIIGGRFDSATDGERS